jgi:hypothetical protein
VGQAMARNWQGSHLISTDRLGHRRGLGHKTVLNSLLAYLTAVSITEQPLPILRPRTQQATFHPELAEKRQLAW